MLEQLIVAGGVLAFLGAIVAIRLQAPRSEAES